MFCRENVKKREERRKFDDLRATRHSSQIQDNSRVSSFRIRKVYPRCQYHRAVGQVGTVNQPVSAGSVPQLSTDDPKIGAQQTCLGRICQQNERGQQVDLPRAGADEGEDPYRN